MKDTTIHTLQKNAYVSFCILQSIYQKCVYWYIFFPSIAIEGVYQYEATVLSDCDPERNAEYRMNIEAETEALISEYLSIISK